MKREPSGAKLNIMLLVNSVFIGGMEEHVRLLARDLDRQQFVVHSVYPQWARTDSFNRRLQRVSDHSAEVTPDRRHGLFVQVRETVRLFRQSRAWRIDLAHLHSTTYTGQLVAIAVLRAAGVRRIFVTEHLAPESRPGIFSRLSRSIVSRNVDAIISVSVRNQQARRRHLFTPENKSFVVDNGVDLDRFSTPATVDHSKALPGLADDSMLVGTAVRFEPGKGLDTLLKAFDLVHRSVPNAHLLMVGDGTLRQELERMADSLASRPNVHFVGFQDDPRPFLAAMDVFVLPVPFGSMSIGLLEAMAMGRPCVITFGGEGEAIVDGESGLFAQPNDAPDLAAKLQMLLTDNALRERLAHGARKRIEDHFSSSRVAAELGDLYRRSTTVPT